MLKTIFDLKTVRLPPTDNHIYGQSGKIRFMYKEARNWKEEMQDFVLTPHPTKGYTREVSEKPLKAIIKFYLKRDRDVHGSGKLIMDTFQGIVYKNDSQFVEVIFKKVVDKKYPRVEILIKEII